MAARVAFCFPDTYEIGMSNLGVRILYGVPNAMDDVCASVFAPWVDMEAEMRKKGIRLSALESGDELCALILSLSRFSTSFIYKRAEHARACSGFRSPPRREAT